MEADALEIFLLMRKHNYHLFQNKQFNKSENVIQKAEHLVWVTSWMLGLLQGTFSNAGWAEKKKPGPLLNNC